jgi:hypothetical protein
VAELRYTATAKMNTLIISSMIFVASVESAVFFVSSAFCFTGGFFASSLISFFVIFLVSFLVTPFAFSSVFSSLSSFCFTDGFFASSLISFLVIFLVSFLATSFAFSSVFSSVFSSLFSFCSSLVTLVTSLGFSSISSMASFAGGSSKVSFFLLYFYFSVIVKAVCTFDQKILLKTQTFFCLENFEYFSGTKV